SLGTERAVGDDHAGDKSRGLASQAEHPDNVRQVQGHTTAGPASATKDEVELDARGAHAVLGVDLDGAVELGLQGGHNGIAQVMEEGQTAHGANPLRPCPGKGRPVGSTGAARPPGGYVAVC